MPSFLFPFSSAYHFLPLPTTPYIKTSDVLKQNLWTRSLVEYTEESKQHAHNSDGCAENNAQIARYVRGILDRKENNDQ
jgi:hypothetical protein